MVGLSVFCISNARFERTLNWHSCPFFPFAASSASVSYIAIRREYTALYRCSCFRDSGFEKGDLVDWPHRFLFLPQTETFITALVTGIIIAGVQVSYLTTLEGRVSSWPAHPSSSRFFFTITPRPIPSQFPRVSLSLLPRISTTLVRLIGHSLLLSLSSRTSLDKFTILDPISFLPSKSPSGSSSSQ